MDVHLTDDHQLEIFTALLFGGQWWSEQELMRDLIVLPLLSMIFVVFQLSQELYY